MDLIIDGLESKKNGDTYHDFVLDDAINSIKRAQEALDEGMANPKKWWTDNFVNTKTFMTLFPFIYMVQQQVFHNLPQKVEENLSPEHEEDSEVEDTSGLD